VQLKYATVRGVMQFFLVFDLSMLTAQESSDAEVIKVCPDVGQTFKEALINSIFRKCCRIVRWQGAQKSQGRRVLPVR
jgi:hypothetical protein